MIFKLFLAAAMTMSLGLTQEAQARRGHHDDRRGHHDDHGRNHDRDRHNDDWDDADTAVAAGLGATLLSLTIDAATRQSTAMIQQAETEALAYHEGVETSQTFQSAKSIFETQAGQTLSDEQAAILIVEYNQALRAQL